MTNADKYFLEQFVLMFKIEHGAKQVLTSDLLKQTFTINLN